jgi:UDP-N-acetylmuramoyl-L-alanyl-D-glutamate--2,6-diaminopimelate ligase
MQLNELLKINKSIQLLQGDKTQDIKYIQSDTRKISSNDIFCVYDSFGDRTEEFIADALHQSVSTVLIHSKNKFLSKAKKFKNVLLSSKDSMLIHGYIASELKNHPSEKVKIIAITGTNGKTSLTYILNDIMTKENKKCGIIGTIQIKFGNKVFQSGYTTPDPSSLNEILDEMHSDGIEYVFMEASSHGLKLGRLNGIHFYGAIFTNITRDHLDFHKTMTDYLKSKFKLFQLLEKSNWKEKFAVISSDSAGSDKLLKLIKAAKFNYPIYELGKNKTYEANLKSLSLTSTEFIFKENQTSHFIITNLLGDFNFINVSLAIIIARNLQVDMESIKTHVDSLIPVNGRFQLIPSSKKNRIGIVDYAHTPDALENILKSIKQIPHSKLICLFGCGGDRDKTKRPIMAKIAAKYSDMVILTSDNPRTEDPEAILDDIQKGLSSRYKNFLRIANRRQAIKKGVEILPDQGILLVAGKGHETVQIIGNKKENFSDSNELMESFKLDDLSRR